MALRLFMKWYSLFPEIKYIGIYPSLPVTTRSGINLFLTAPSILVRARESLPFLGSAAEPCDHKRRVKINYRDKKDHS